MRKFVSGMLVFAVYWSMFLPFVRSANAQVVGKARDMKMKDVPPGLQFRLSEGSTGAESRVKQPLAATDPLSEGAAADILKRLPGIKSDPDDQTDFAKRLGTLPAPKNGRMIPIKFPSDEQRGTPKVNPGTSLEVIRSGASLQHSGVGIRSGRKPPNMVELDDPARASVRALCRYQNTPHFRSERRKYCCRIYRD